MSEQVTSQAVAAGAQPWNPPWAASSDPTKLTTLTNLRNAFPKSTNYGASITAEQAFALVRGQAGFNPTPVFGVDVEADGLAYCRMNWLAL
jgi:hypothetical protein